MRKFTLLRDDSDTYMEALPVSARAFLLITIEDLHALTGDATGDRWCADVALVDLDVMPASQIQYALDSWGISSEDAATLTPLALAEICHSWGAKAPLDSSTGGNRRNLHREARKTAREYASDPDALDAVLDRPVNALGSTAREFAAGDITSAMTRGCAAGSMTAQIVARMHGASHADIATVEIHGPADPIAAWCGYCDGKAGRDPESGASPDYYAGHLAGVDVAAGRRGQPAWIRG